MNTLVTSRIVLLAALAAVLATLYATGAFEWVADVDRVRASLESLGNWGPLLYVLAFAFLCPFFVPGIAFVIPGAVVFGYPELLLYSWIGAVGAGIVGFTFARTLGRSFVEKHMPPVLHRYDQRLADNGVRTVILVRLTLFLAPPGHWALGLSRVRLSEFLVGTAIGFIPGIALLTYTVAFLGSSLGPWLMAQPVWAWLALAAAILGVLLLVLRLGIRLATSAAAD